MTGDLYVFLQRQKLLVTFRSLIGHDCVTPFQAVVVLKAHRGLYNRSAELVKLNRGKLKNISSAFSGLDSKLKKFVGRANDIIFSLKEPVKRNFFLRWKITIALMIYLAFH